MIGPRPVCKHCGGKLTNVQIVRDAIHPSTEFIYIEGLAFKLMHVLTHKQVCNVVTQWNRKGLILPARGRGAYKIQTEKFYANG